MKGVDFLFPQNGSLARRTSGGGTRKRSFMPRMSFTTSETRAGTPCFCTWIGRPTEEGWGKFWDKRVAVYWDSLADLFSSLVSAKSFCFPLV